jgi:hypothetical protein
VYSVEGGKVETSFLSLFFCKALLVADCSHCPNLVKTSKSHMLHQKKTTSVILNGDYHSHVLEHLDGNK